MTTQCEVTVYSERGAEPLPRREDLCEHARGFSWGYGGAGPAQLALALLAHVLGAVAEDVVGTDPELRRELEQRALELHQLFKEQVIARLPERRWLIRGEDVLGWLHGTPARRLMEAAHILGSVEADDA